MEVDIPLYGAAFVSPELLVVVGGGGKGKHGLANKVMILQTAGGTLSTVAQHNFPANSDCPMSVAVQDTQIIVGVNGENEQSHVQIFDDKLVPVTERRLFSVKGAYERVSAASSAHIAAVGAANSGESPLVVLDSDLSILWENDLKTDLRDVSFNKSGMLAALEPGCVHFYNETTGKEVHIIKAPQGGKFSRGQFVSDTKYAVAVQFAAKKRVELYLYKIEDKPMLINSSRISLPSVSALATNGEIIAVGGANGHVQAFNTRLSVLQRPKPVHKLPVSGIAVSCNGEIASTSVAGTVHILSPPFGERSLFGGLAVAGWTFLSVAVLAVLVALVYSRIQTLAISASHTQGTAEPLLGIQTVPNPVPNREPNREPTEIDSDSVAIAGEGTAQVAPSPEPEPTAELESLEIIEPSPPVEPPLDSSEPVIDPTELSKPEL